MNIMLNEVNMTLPTWLLSPESQAVLMTAIIIILSCVTVTWMIHAIVAILWPLSFILLIFVLFLPETTDHFFKDLLSTDKLRQWIQYLTQQVNNAISALQGYKQRF
ncbi:hypothetical protein L9F63_001316 [Diploptera punctata]|uniref:Uncharacterized protein n=1 Tax=Diploptera punctata TaxID=6984 RepID=A0AAD8A4X7_DIPPU|nr:hypothetical protein L9F63_001316 [Diploptera punctata]